MLQFHKPQNFFSHVSLQAVLLFIASACAALYTVHEERNFLQWMRDTNNLYTGEEYHFRLGVFMTTLRYIEDFNRDKTKSYRLGLNSLSAMTRTEYMSLLGYRPGPAKGIHRTTLTGRRVAPDAIDWREKGVVNPIKEQGHCGSCWAFGAIQACESSYALKSNQLISFSESNLVDCCTLCFGCSGGRPENAMDYIIKYQDGKFNTEEDYPYAPIEHKCAFDPNKAVGSLTSWVEIEKNELALKEVIGTSGPCSVGINGGPNDFHQYSGGIYNNPECLKTVINHGVGCVGYGAENGVEYWIIRNSWGASWGEQGYVRLARNAGNICAIGLEAYLAIA